MQIDPSKVWSLDMHSWYMYATVPNIFRLPFSYAYMEFQVAYIHVLYGAIKFQNNKFAQVTFSCLQLLP